MMRAGNPEKLKSSKFLQQNEINSTTTNISFQEKTGINISQFPIAEN